MMMILPSFVALAGVVAAAPFSLPNGFPNPSAANLAQIENQAGGTLPNTALPTSLPADAIQSLQVIAVNEIFETSYFSNLLDNVTNSVHGYTSGDLAGMSKSYVIEALTAIRAVSRLPSIQYQSHRFIC
jgi:hypothetical protein